MRIVEDFKELIVFDNELFRFSTPIDDVTITGYVDIGKNVGVSYEQQRIVTLMDGILDPLRFKRPRNNELLHFQLAKFRTPLLRAPSDGTLLGPSKLWSLSLVEASRKCFKKL